MTTKAMTTNPSPTPFIFEGDFLNVDLVVKCDGSRFGSHKKFNVFSRDASLYYLLPSICKKRKKGENRGIGVSLPEVLGEKVVGSLRPFPVAP